MLFVLLISILKQESASLVMTKTTAPLVTRESGLVQEGILMTPTRVETRPAVGQIMVVRRSKLWVTVCLSDVPKKLNIFQFWKEN